MTGVHLIGGLVPHLVGTPVENGMCTWTRTNISGKFITPQRNRTHKHTVKYTQTCKNTYTPIRTHTHTHALNDRYQSFKFVGFLLKYLTPMV